ncbi:MAG: response regulator transcription factor [Candidatus Eisenbacteria bacterium]|uniref:Response regulator transcription factor n=1 Tax=Eiseniibacteriota bacterium TaxID=2212470 RepID=A0A7Y2H3Q1_UNCEI|nr:response regulator transcription factor [Candidatus Eisenbacteria bacterium]
METTVVLADDHALFLEGLRSLLAQEPDIRIVAEASSGAEAVDAVQRTKPEVVVMDVTMPGLNGIEATRQIVHQYPDTKVLCLSMHGGSEFVTAALERGASGYLMKDCPLEELVKAIRCISAGQMYLSPSVAGVAVSGLMAGATTPSISNLSSREMEVLQLIAEGHETKHIAEKLHLSAKTVATHRANLTEKLGVRGTADLTKFAIRHGIASMDAPGSDD